MAKKFPTDRLKNRIAANADRTRKVLLIHIVILCLTTAIMNLFGTYIVTVNCTSISFFGTDEYSYYLPISQLYEGDKFVAVMILSIIYGAGNIALMCLALILFVQAMKSSGRDKLYTLFAIAGLGINIVYMILFTIFGSRTDHSMYITDGPEIESSLEVHFITWINVLMFALLFALALAKVSTAKKPAVEAAETPVE